MMIRRLAARFVLQLLAAGVLLVVVAAATGAWMLVRYQELEMERDFAPAGLERMIRQAELAPDGSLLLDEHSMRMLERDGGWVQQLDEYGNVLQSFQAPAGLPDQYEPGWLMDIWLDRVPFPYRLGLWVQEKAGHTITLLYGTSEGRTALMEAVLRETVVVGPDLLPSPEVLRQLNEAGAWLQLLDQGGSELASFGKPPGAIEQFTLQDLALRSIPPTGSKGAFESAYDREMGYTWLLHMPAAGDEGATRGTGMLPELLILLKGIAVFLLAALLIVLLLSVVYAYRFGVPFVRLMEWIRALESLGRQEDVSEAGRSAFYSKQGALRRRYRVFREMIQSVSSLQESLRRAEAERSQAERNREEWMAGVTHDMKTPLSSIKGYAHLIQEPTYEWSKEELRGFAATIVEKSEYMDQLIDDFNLAYRLKSGAATQPSKERVDLAAWLPEAVDRAALSGVEWPRDTVLVEVPVGSVWAEMHLPWLYRVIHNLVINSLRHNPAGTKVAVALTRSVSGAFTIEVRDDGIGMDRDMVMRLFERGFRGTSTDERTEGSGLGMSVAKALTEAMGGCIRVSSVVGEGTTVTLEWIGGPK